MYDPSVPLLQMRLSFADGLFWSSVVCCAFAQYFIIRSVAGRRHLAEPSANLPRQRGALEILWAIAPAVGLAVLLVFTWRAMHPPSMRDRAAALVPELTR
jgi:heme/copper-type cytochrome/quinol oxidase subunit 2